MTLLGRSDGESGASYLDLAGFLIQHGSNVEKDLEELWRRIVFNIAVKNTDDHLRNHGFILEQTGWALSPAFDINPNPYGHTLTLNISETDNSLDFDLARSVGKYFRIDQKKMEVILGQIKAATEKWLQLAKQLRLPVSDQDIMTQAFEGNL